MTLGLAQIIIGVGLVVEKQQISLITMFFHAIGAKNSHLSEPMFLVYVLMACRDYDKLLSIERDMHLRGFDTVFKLT